MSAIIADYDSAEVLNTPARIAAYMEAAMEDGDPALVAHALGVVARAHGMAQIAGETGRSRETLYRSLSDKGNPNLTTLTMVLKAVGLQLSVKPIPTETGEPLHVG